MAPFDAPQSIPAKRKSDADEGPPRKRQTLGIGTLGVETYWSVQWRYPQTKKHKTWEGDGVIIVEGTKVTLFDTEGKSLGTGTNNLGRALQTDDELLVGGKDVLLEGTVDPSDFNAGRCFGNGGLPTESTTISRPRLSASRFKPPVPKQGAHIPLQPVNNLYRPPERHVHYPSLEKREDVTNLFKDETPMGEMVRADWDTKYSGKFEKVDPTIEALWEVEWRKPSAKKNKTWEGDGLLHQKGSVVRFFSEDGSKLLGSRTYDYPLRPGAILSMSEKELQIQRELPLSRLDNRATEKEIQTLGEDRENNPIAIHRAPNPNKDLQSRVHKFVPPKITKRQVGASDEPGVAPRLGIASKAEGPLFDPNAEGAIVMKSPSPSHQSRFNPQNKPVVPVVVDPLLGRRLRPHQIEGVKFMYECVMGMAKHEGNGCILADAMGLGKTLQTIALIWTLLKQNPYSGKGPIIGRALIVCPVSLINNWKAEFHKWIGRDRIGVMTGDQDKARIKQFIYAKHFQVLIIGYEKLRSVIAELAYCQPAIGLIVCDEGHRLKSAENKTSKMFEALKTRRRIILSGTPIQNNLNEFHSMADFCNPGLMDEYATFKRVYETPILLARAPDASPRTREQGEVRVEQLQTVAKSFVLRREATILGNYLPPKFEYVVFVSPTRIQLAMLSKILSKDAVNKLAHSSTAKSLAAIGSLMKLCNSPMLLMKNGLPANKPGGKQGDSGDDPDSDAISQAITCIPREAKFADVSLSGKLIVLANILRTLRKTTDEKCVIVSHYTSTLNIIEQFCNKRKYLLYRLDGQTPAHRRQEYVDSFNKSSQEKRFVFLLSTKAGGVGLNLIGASRLILVDSDWNPSHDLQAMARIHRDGQKRPVHIYRLLTTGTIDEKIFQRQITKIGLSEAMMAGASAEGKSKSDSFTHRELRDLFTFDPNTACGTHDLIQCPCEKHRRHEAEADGGSGTHEESEEDEAAHGKNRRAHRFVEVDSSDSEPDMGFVSATQVRPDQYEKAYQKRRKEALAALGEWTHINCLRASAPDEIQDEILGKVLYIPETEDRDQGPQPDFDTAAAEVDRTLQALEAGDFSDLCDDSEPAEKMYELRDLPGGSVTYVFEKASRSSL